MNKEAQLKKLEDAFKTLKQQINSDFHIPMADEDPQLTSVILAVEKIAYHAICAITPVELKTIPIIKFAEFNPCESCNGSGIKIDDSERIGHQIKECYSCNGTGRKI